MKKNKNKNNLSLYIIGILLLSIGIFFIYKINSDTSTIKKSLIKDKAELSIKISNYNDRLDKIYKQTDSLSKSKLFLLQENSIDLKKELHHFENEKEEIIKELFMQQLKYWAYLIAILTSLIVFTGLRLNIKEKVNKIINDSIKGKEEIIKQISDEKSWEFRLMEKSNIIVVNPHKDKDAKNLDPILKWFEKKGGLKKNISEDFNAPDKIKTQITESFDNERFNIVLLENSDGNWHIDFRNKNDKDNIKNARKIAKGLPENTMLVYFGPKEAGDFPNRLDGYFELYDDKSDNTKREIKRIIDHISFVNTPSKLYPNLIDALKYLDIINLNKNA